MERCNEHHARPTITIFVVAICHAANFATHGVMDQPDLGGAAKVWLVKITKPGRCIRAGHVADPLAGRMLAA